MNEINYLNKAYILSLFAHSGQVDKGRNDYFNNHVIKVVENVKGIENKTVAFLHDVVEDTVVNQSYIEYAFPQHIAKAVFLLTKNKSSPYEIYISKIKENDLARTVKIADIKSNMDLSRLNREPNKSDLKRIEKYKKYLTYLED